MTQTFTPPVLEDGPQFLPETRPDLKRFWGHFRRRARGVNVYKLSDGTYVQDRPTDENSNTLLPPYPLMPDQVETNLVSVSYDYLGNRITTEVNPSVVHIYLGGHEEEVSDAEAALLTAAGYGGCLS